MCRRRAFERIGHLSSLPLPGGDAAAREPWRMALAVLWKMGERAESSVVGDREGLSLALSRCSTHGGGARHSTSCGRWFDAACGLLGVRDRNGYEGEAAMVLESLVRRPRVLPGSLARGRRRAGSPPAPRRTSRMSPQDGADVFHGSLAAALVELAYRLSPQDRVIALGGGCVVNSVLTRGLVEGFTSHGVRVLLPRRAPAGDGGLALGQAWVCAQAIWRRLRCASRCPPKWSLCTTTVRPRSPRWPQEVVSLALLDGVREGDYVVVHTGIRPQPTGCREAERTLAVLRRPADRRRPGHEVRRRVSRRGGGARSSPTRIAVERLGPIGTTG